jgi:hypothetical protein
MIVFERFDNIAGYAIYCHSDHETGILPVNEPLLLSHFQKINEFSVGEEYCVPRVYAHISAIKIRSLTLYENIPFRFDGQRFTAPDGNTTSLSQIDFCSLAPGDQLFIHGNNLFWCQVKEKLIDKEMLRLKLVFWNSQFVHWVERDVYINLKSRDSRLLQIYNPISAYYDVEKSSYTCISLRTEYQFPIQLVKTP